MIQPKETIKPEVKGMSHYNRGVDIDLEGSRVGCNYMTKLF